MGQNCPEDVCFRSELVEARAKELGFWQGLTFRMERWLADGKSEAGSGGPRGVPEPHRRGLRRLPRKGRRGPGSASGTAAAPPLQLHPHCLENVPIQNVSWLVDGLLPMGEVSLLGADGGTGKGIWQAQLIAYVTAGRTSGFFPSRRRRPAASSFFPGRTTPARCSKPA